MPVSAQTKVEVLSGSRLTIEGRSTINRFVCTADSVAGSGALSDNGAEATLMVAVRELDCGKDRMNRDLQEAMKADRHPEIQFELVSAERAGNGDHIRVTGLLSLAGVSRKVALTTELEKTAPGTYRVRGEQQLNMSDFGIQPPTALAGIIRAYDAIIVHFDVRAKENPSTRREPVLGLTNQAL